MNQFTLDLQPADQSYRKIPLTQGQFSIVDASDYDSLLQWKWCAAWSKKTKSFYAIRSQYRPGRGPKCVRMHRQIMEAAKGVLVDHRNHDTLDNRRRNLRIASDSQNCANRVTRGKVGLKGVWLDGGKWRASVTHSGKRINLGRFQTAELAHAAYLEAAHEYHGEFACV